MYDPARWIQTLRIVGAWLVCGCVLVACSSDGGPSPVDGGAERDALVVEAGPQPDAGADAAADSDAGMMPISCPPGECDPRKLEACGEGSCVLMGDAPMCFDGALVGKEEGQSCDAVTDCAEGLACFLEVDGGVCGRPCCPDGMESCPGGQRCVGSGVLIGEIATAWWRCVAPRPCDLLAMDGGGCAVGEACYIVSDLGATDCMREGAAGPGEACVAPNDCQAGLFCGARGTCERICRLAAGPDACPEGQYCSMYRHTPDGAGLCTPETTSR